MPITGNHIPDEQLLAYLDGEAGLRERYRTRLHLFACWNCRTRLMEMKEAVRLACEAYLYQSYPSLRDVENARRRWLEAVLQADLNQARSTRRNALRRLVSPRWMGGVVAAAAASTLLTLPVLRRAPLKERAEVPAAPLRREFVSDNSVAVPLPPARAFRKEPVPARPPVDLDAVEARAEFLLHGLGVCRGEAVRLERSTHGLRLTGYVASQERRDQIAGTLAAAGLVPPIVSELKHWESAAPESPMVQGGGVTHTEAPSRTILAEAALKRYLRSHGVTDPERLRNEITRVTDEAFHYSDNARTAASALKHLAERWSPRALAGLDASARRLVLTVVLSHVSELSQDLDHLARVCGPLFEPDHQDETPAISESPSWQETVQRLSPEIHQLHRLSAALFARDRLPDDVPEAIALSRFATQLRTLSGSVTVLEHMTRSESSQFQVQRREP